MGVDNQKRGMNEDFQIGNSNLEYPGDPKGQPEDIINCHCAMVHERKLGDISEESGQLTEEESGQLTQEEILTFNKYTSDYSYRFNNALRTGKNVTEEIGKDAEILSRAINRGKKFKGECYRGMKLANEKENVKFLNNIKEGNIFSDKGFLSSSVDMEEAVNFTKGAGKNKYIFKIKSNKGIDISQYSKEGYELEKEILFNKKTSFTINSHQIKVIDDDIYHIIKMTEL